MKVILNSMKKRNSGISEDRLPVFERIIETSERSECEGKFAKAMEEYLSREERFRLFEQHGSCSGTGYDKERRAFAQEHADMPLKERLALYTGTHGRTAVLNDDNTITVTFACHHGYYKHTPKGNFHYGASVETYFERCAGGRLYEYQKALGIKLRIKSVDVSPLEEDPMNPVIFTFEVVES